MNRAGILNRTYAAGLLGVVSLGMAGCGGVGTDRALFVTSSNVGINIESQPPVAEISVARRELAIAPSFEGGRTPPLIASFGFRDGGTRTVDVHDNFAGGDAAVAMAGLLYDATPSPANPAEYDSSLCIAGQHPEGPGAPRPSSHRALDLAGPGEVSPLVLGTNTTFGLTFGWAGMAATMPDTFRFGYNRKQIALAPVTVSPGCAAMPNPAPQNPVTVRLPSFLATMSGDTQGGPPTEAGTRVSQFFATGRSATSLAIREEVRVPFVERAVPANPPSCTYEKNGAATAIMSWARAAPANMTALTGWVQSNVPSKSITQFFNCREYAESRASFIAANNIPTTP